MADPAAFLDLLARAELRSASGDWAEAAELWARDEGWRTDLRLLARELKRSRLLGAQVETIGGRTVEDHRTWIAPDIYAPPTFEAYRRNDTRPWTRSWPSMSTSPAADHPPGALVRAGPGRRDDLTGGAGRRCWWRRPRSRRRAGAA
jgi:hypothetical protein